MYIEEQVKRWFAAHLGLMNCKIKICGITNFDDASFTAELGVQYLGFNFYKKSKRFITPVLAGEIIKRLSPTVKTVGVFVNPTRAEIKEVMKNVSLDFMQFHGDEELSFISQYKNYKLIKAFQIEDIGLENKITEWLQLGDYVLLDAYTPTQYGGTGEKIEQVILDYYQQGLDFSRVFLAGGLNSTNVSELVMRYQPYAVDVASGVETQPGIKSKELVLDFVKKIKEINPKE